MRRARFIALLVLALGLLPVAVAAAAPADRQAILNHLGALEAQARAAIQAKDYPGAVVALRAMLAAEKVPGLADFDAQIQYQIACALARSGDPEGAMTAVAAAAKAGFAEAEGAEKDADLAALRKRPAFVAALAVMRRNQIERRTYVVRVWDNPERAHLDLHHFDDTRSADATRLRARLPLAPGGTQLERQRALLDQVHRAWAHSGLMEPPTPNAHAILDAVAQGGRFRCVEYSVVLAQALNAWGFPARVLRLRADGMSFGTGRGHVVTEVWNDDLAQWVVMDGQNNALWTLGDRPLSAVELQARVVAGTAGEVRLEHQGSAWLPEPPDRATWLRYFHYVGYLLDNRLFDAHPAGPPPALILLSGAQTPELLFQGQPLSERFTRGPAQVAPVMNRVRLQVQARADAPRGDVLDVRFEPLMPSFDHVEVNGAAHPGETFEWRLTAGDNRLEVVPVNAQGVRGRASVVVVDYHPPGS